MWIVVPLVPILIGIFCISFGLFGEIQSHLQTINTIVMVIMALVFIGIAIYNITRRTSVLQKVFSTITCVICGIISTTVLRFLIQELAAIEFGLFGLLEFAFVLLLGGSICSLIVIGCIMVCCWFSNWKIDCKLYKIDQFFN